MLEARGVEVTAFLRCNDDIDESSLAAKANVVVNTIWSRRSRSELTEALRKSRPDVVHVHNTFAILSPSIYGACRRAQIPVVQTLHNFRFFCPGSMFLRDGKPCEDCIERSLWQSVRHRCYRNSLGATAALATMLTVHRSLGTYSRDIARYIALTEFARKKIIKAGIAGEKLVIKPNFIPSPPAQGNGGGDYAIFVGRLFEGKGVETLVKAWRSMPHFKLRILGDGALRPQLEAFARSERLNVEFAGRQPKSVVLQSIAEAKFLIMPSEWYEGFPMVIAESYACGTPVLASQIGSLDELVEEGVTGRKFAAGDPNSLAQAAQRMFSDTQELARMRSRARAYFDANLTEEKNYEQLVKIYAGVIQEYARGEKCLA
jgi:glycosyltransferase involved in cell wall biosynthesis